MMHRSFGKTNQLLKEESVYKLNFKEKCKAIISEHKIIVSVKNVLIFWNVNMNAKNPSIE